MSQRAVLGAGTGNVIGHCHQRHWAVEFRKFLDTIAAEVPSSLHVHLIVDNYATHKTASIRNWLGNQTRSLLRTSTSPTGPG